MTRSSAARAREDELMVKAIAIAERLNLRKVIYHRASALSGGQKKLLEIGRALMADPKMILLDEPIAGVNPTLAREIGEHLQALAAEGLPITPDRASADGHDRSALRPRHRHGRGPLT